jgi:hypothetical protein
MDYFILAVKIIGFIYFAIRFEKSNNKLYWGIWFLIYTIIIIK